MRVRQKTSSSVVRSDVGTLEGFGGSYWLSNLPWDGKLNSQNYERLIKQETQEVSVSTNTVFKDVVLENFTKLRRDGEILPTNKMVKTEIEVPTAPLRSRSGLVMRSNVRKDPYYPHTSAYDAYLVTAVNRQIVLDSVQLPPDLDSKVINEVAIIAKAKLYKQGMDYLTSGAEVRKTLAMLTGLKSKMILTVKNAVITFINVVRARKIKFKNLTHFYNEFQAWWLEGRFGWRILYYDLVSIQKYLAEEIPEKLVVGRSAYTEHSEKTLPNGLVQTDTWDIRIGYPGICDTTKLGHLDIVNTAYEITPFSLVLDMFFNVQDRILAWSFTDPDNVRSLPDSSFIVSEKRRVVHGQSDPTGEIHRLILQGYPYVQHQHTGGLVSLAASSKERDIGPPMVPTWPLPRLPQGYVRLDLLMLLKPLYDAFFRIKK